MTAGSCWSFGVRYQSRRVAMVACIVVTPLTNKRISFSGQISHRTLLQKATILACHFRKLISCFFHGWDGLALDRRRTGLCLQQHAGSDGLKIETMIGITHNNALHFDSLPISTTRISRPLTSVEQGARSCQ